MLWGPEQVGRVGAVAKRRVCVHLKEAAATQLQLQPYQPAYPLGRIF